MKATVYDLLIADRQTEKEMETSEQSYKELMFKNLSYFENIKKIENVLSVCLDGKWIAVMDLV